MKFRILIILLLSFTFNLYSQTEYIKNEEEAKAAYSLALFYKERAIASKVLTEDSYKDLQSAITILKEVLKFEENEEVYITLADTYEVLGLYKDSASIYDKLILNNPNSVNLLIKAGERNIFFLGDIKKARYYLETALEIDSTNNDALILLGFISYNDRKFRKAIHYFSQVNTSRYTNKNYLWYYNFYYGMSNFYLSRFSLALNTLQKIDINRLSPNDKQDAIYGIIKSYQALEDYNMAYSNSLKVDNADIFTAYLAFMSDNTNKFLDSVNNNDIPMDENMPKIVSIMLALQNDGYSNALNIIETSLDRNEIDLDIIQIYYKIINKVGSVEDKIKAEMDIISFYFAINNLDSIPKHIDKLISYDNNTSMYNSLYLQVAYKMKEEKRFEESKKLLKKYASISNHSISESELSSFVIIATEVGEYDLALQMLDRESNSESMYSYLKAYVFLMKKDIENANLFLDKDLEYVKTLNTTNEYRLTLPYITALATTNANSAIYYSNLLYERDKDNAENINTLAWSLVVLDKDLDKAINLSKKAIKLQPKSSHYLDTLAYAYYKKQDYNRALRTILRALLYVDETSKAEVYLHTANIYYAKKDMINALKYYRKSYISEYKDISYNEVEVKEKIDSIVKEINSGVY